MPDGKRSALVRYAIAYQSVLRRPPPPKSLAAMAGADETTILSAIRELPRSFTITEVKRLLRGATLQTTPTHPSYLQKIAQLLRLRKSPKAPHPHHNHVFQDEDRLYFELIEPSADQSPTAKRVATFLGERGYTVTDYKGGYCTDVLGKQTFKIARLLQDNPNLKKSFVTDKARTGSGLMVVISRHPYDIARMSTGRAWSSCMAKNGENYHYVAKDIKHGTVVAYLVRKDDPNITDPLSRQLLKPYSDNEGGQVLAPQHVYGVKSQALEMTTAAICAHLFNPGKSGQFKMHPDLYPDGMGEFCIVAEDGTITIANQQARHLPDHLRDGTGTATQLLYYLGIPYTPKTDDQGQEWLIVTQNIDLSNHGIHRLPQGFTRVVIQGELSLSNNPITELPQGLSVAGTLYLQGTAITELPQGLYVGGSLYMENTAITELPQGLYVGGGLYLLGTAIAKLPDDLHVAGRIDCGPHLQDAVTAFYARRDAGREPQATNQPGHVR